MEKESLQNLQKIIDDQNPWRDESNEGWESRDGALREIKKAEQEGLYSPPKFMYYLRKSFFEPAFINEENSGILIIRGPRRIGKTSSIKYIISEMISEGYSRNSFLYLSLDLDELLFELDKKRELRSLLTEIIKNYKKVDAPLILILDEVTFYKGWARVLKNLVDAGDIGSGVSIIATGSYSLDLSSAKRELSGRFGNLGEACGEDLLFPPRRFIEVAESVISNSTEFRNFLAKTIGRFATKTGLMEYLGGFQEEEDAEKYGYIKILNELMEKYYSDLKLLLESNYFFAGGYPRKVYQAIISSRDGEVNVPDKRYLSDIYDLIISDSKKFGLDESILRQMLSKINLSSMRIGGDFNFFRELNTKKLKEDECKKYISYLTSSGLFSFMPVIEHPDQIDHLSNFVNPSNKKLKLVVRDPAVFFAIYFGSRNIDKIFKRATKTLEENPSLRESLFESIILSHLYQLPALKKNQSNNLAFILNKELEQKEGTEPADGLVWYLNFKDKMIILPIEVKFTQESLDKFQIKKRAKLLKTEYGLKRLIVVTNQKTLEINEHYVIIPAEIFLLLT